MFQCLFANSGAFANNVINYPVLKNVAMQTLNKTNQSRWLPIVNEAIDVCKQKTEANAARLENSLKKQKVDNVKVCHPGPEFMASCIFFHQIQKCPFPTPNIPQGLIKKCNRLRSHYQVCNTLPLHE